MIKAIIFDMGDTLMEELDDTQTPIDAKDVVLLPDTVEVVQHLSQHYLLGGITNATTSMEKHVWTALYELGIGQHFKAIVSSVDRGMSKPDPRAFRECLSQLGVEPHEAVMVGDRLDTDIRGAKAVGMRTVWFRWNDKYKAHPDWDEEPDARISRLSQLPATIAQLAEFP